MMEPEICKSMGQTLRTLAFANLHQELKFYQVSLGQPVFVCKKAEECFGGFNTKLIDVNTFVPGFLVTLFPLFSLNKNTHLIKNERITKCYK